MRGFPNEAACGGRARARRLLKAGAPEGSDAALLLPCATMPPVAARSEWQNKYPQMSRVSSGCLGRLMLLVNR